MIVILKTTLTCNTERFKSLEGIHGKVKGENG